MSKKRIITISRSFGSGGRMIGEELARRLGCYVYCAPFFWRPPTPHVLAALRPP